MHPAEQRMYMQAHQASLAVAHVVARAIYPILYIADQDKLRSVVWMIGFLATLGLLALPLAP